MREEECGYSTGSVFLSFLLGGLVGAGFALLLAPQSGRETRQKIKELSYFAAVRPERLCEEDLMRERDLRNDQVADAHHLAPRVDLPRNPHEGVGLVDFAVRALCEQHSAVPRCGRKRNERITHPCRSLRSGPSRAASAAPCRP